MPRFSTKHPERQQTFSFKSFHGGLNTDVQANFLDESELSAASNVKYVHTRDAQGNMNVTLRTRNGTVKISNTALSGGADVLACTYYKTEAQYIVATASKVYYLDGSLDPVEIGSISSTPTFTEFNGKLIIHDGGATKAWNGTTFETLEDTFTGELLGTGDGATTEFSGTIDNPAVNPTEFDITFTDTTIKAIGDDGLGRLTGDVDAAWTGTPSGTANNGAGLIRVTDAAHPYVTNDEVNIQGVAGTTEANNTVSNPTWTVTKIDANTYDLQGSTYTNAWAGGGSPSSSLNTVIYSTGAYVFKADGAPDTGTPITATYEKTDSAPKSKGGFVRASRLYLYGDADNPSRVWYSGVNDEDAWDDTSDGGYFDVDPNDGDSVVAGLSFFDSLIVFKESSSHRVNDFPGDASFSVKPLIKDVGCIAYMTAVNEGDLVTFLSRSGWMRLAATDKYGDIARADIISKTFNRRVVEIASSGAQACYNQQDNQLWLMLKDGSTFETCVHVIHLSTGGQYSQYRFAFVQSCFNYVNGEMLIGGTDGHLYRLSRDETVYQDNAVSFASDTYIRTAYTDWGMPANRKLNKRTELKLLGRFSLSGNIKFYKDYGSGAFKTVALPDTYGRLEIFGDGPDYEIYDMQNVQIAPNPVTDFIIRNKYNYKNTMLELSDLYGLRGVEVYGIEMSTGIIGE